MSESFDQNHFERVNLKLEELESSEDIDDCSREMFSPEEIRKGIGFLNSGKAPGLDGITKEHIKNAGPTMLHVITILFNWILRSEYIPVKGDTDNPLQREEHINYGCEQL